MSDVHSSDLDADTVDDGGFLPTVANGELYGAVQLLFSMMQPGDQPVIVQVAGPSGGEGASTIASSLARIVNAATHLGVGLIYLAENDEHSSEVLDIARLSMVAQADVGSPALKADTQLGVVSGRLPARSRGNAMAGGLRAELKDIPPDIGLIIVDTSPILTSLEASAVSRQVDGVLLVLEAERSTVSEIESAQSLVERAGGKILGVILNKRRFHVPAFLARSLGLPFRKHSVSRSLLAIAIVFLSATAIDLAPALAQPDQSMRFTMVPDASSAPR